MKTLLLLASFLIAGSARAVAAQGTNTLSPTNGMIFSCTNGWHYTATNVILRGHVCVFDQASDMYLECDLLTMWFQTNVTKQARTNRNARPAAVPTAAQTNQVDPGGIESIVAEGNVFITTPDSQIVGDHAVYTATNDLVVVTGDMVILGNAQGVGLGQKVIFERASGTAHGIGPFAFESLGKISLGGTNAVRKPATNSPSAIPTRSPGK
jgi:hypothetical protein